MRPWRSLQNCGLASGFVKMSANWLSIWMYSIPMVLSTTWDRKWCSRIEKCLVRGRVRWFVASLMQLMLPSKVRHLIFGVEWCIGKPLDFKSGIKLIILITERRAKDKATYSASIVLSAVINCIELFHSKGQPAYMTTNPVRERVEIRSWDDSYV